MPFALATDPNRDSVARRGVPPVITRSQSNDNCLPSLGLVSTLTCR
jgi:hypothetical protein